MFISSNGRNFFNPNISCVGVGKVVEVFRSTMFMVEICFVFHYIHC